MTRETVAALLLVLGIMAYLITMKGQNLPRELKVGDTCRFHLGHSIPPSKGKILEIDYIRGWVKVELNNNEFDVIDLRSADIIAIQSTKKSPQSPDN